MWCFRGEGEERKEKEGGRREEVAVGERVGGELKRDGKGDAAPPRHASHSTPPLSPAQRMHAGVLRDIALEKAELLAGIAASEVSGGECTDPDICALATRRFRDVNNADATAPRATSDAAATAATTAAGR